MTAYAERVSRAQEALRAAGYAGAILGPTQQMRYLTGWTEEAHERLIALFLPASGEPAFVVPDINAAQARSNPAGIPDVRGWRDEEGWQGVAADLLSTWNGADGTLAVDDDLPSAHLLVLQSILPGVRWEAAGQLMARLRQIKAQDELEHMERSAAVTDAVYAECVPAMREGMTELALQEAVTQSYRRRGTSPDFAIIAFGPNTALPHHHSGDARLKRGDVVIMDIGCIFEDYCSDITRTVAFGAPEPEASQVYEVVYEAHRAALKAGKPGLPAEEVDRAARQVIVKAGYGEFFIHRTGHGIGLSCHEPPYIVEGNHAPLREGMCFSDEPGIYLPGRFGVRVENIVTVTAGGLRYLNAAPSPTLLIV